MSMPKPLKSQEVLDVVKHKLSKQEGNIEIVEQTQCKSKLTTLPSLKIESFILFKNLNDNCLYIAKTENIQVQQILNVEEFKEIASKLPNSEQKKLSNILNKINVQNTTKPKI